MPPGIFRLRVEYAKSGRLRYLGHLEVLSTIDRCVRRARLPFALTQGFSPRMKINFTSALPVGCASRQEYYDLFLTEYVPSNQALEVLIPATPPDLAPCSAAYVPWGQAALEALLTRSDWELLLEGEVDAGAMDEALQAISCDGELTFMRGKKARKVDLNRTLVGWELDAHDEGVRMELSTRTGQGTSLRPEILAKRALARSGADLEKCVVHVERVAQWAELEDGALAPAL